MTSASSTLTVGQPTEIPDAAKLARSLRQVSLVTSVCMPLGALIGLSLGTLLPLALIGTVALGGLYWSLRDFGTGRSRLPDLVTSLRVVLTALLAYGTAARAFSAAVAALLVLLVFVLDGLDGVLARKLDASSPRGAHFDMEADAFLVLTVCCLSVLSGRGPWVLTGGLLRYVYVLTLPLLREHGEAPRSRFGRYAFAASLTALTLSLVTSGMTATACAAVGTAILLWSFGRSWLWAFRQRA